MKDFFMEHLQNVTLKLTGQKRPRRLRSNEHVRALYQENILRIQNLIAPIFVSEHGSGVTQIKTLPGIERIPLENLQTEIEHLWNLGLRSFLLFPVENKNKKTPNGEESANPNNLLCRAVRICKETKPESVIFADVALDPFTTHGHDGILNPSTGEILNDETTAALCEMSLQLAAAGVTFVAPSDMMDGRIACIRHALDFAGYKNTGILAYSAKFASSFYGPFREAVQSGAMGLDKRTYQLSFENTRPALLEAILDEQENADILMVKPALCYLDILKEIRQKSLLPIAAYHVSGEYAMLKFAAQFNAIHEEKAVLETLTSIRRAGADMIVSYYAKEAVAKGWVK
jgi:porphobilinogen synthase